MSEELLIEIDLGVTPEAAVSGAVLLQSEDRAYLTFNAMRDTNRPFKHGEFTGFYKEDAGTAVVELLGCVITKFGYPNDEGWGNKPLTKDCSYGVFEVKNSSWKKALLGAPERSEKHFMFLFHDSSFECIASGLRVEVLAEPYDRVFSKVASRVLSLPDA
jgi:hypothetical protein